MNLTNRMIKTKLQNFVKYEELEIEDDDVGLCDNFDLENIPNIEEMFQSWEHYSGNRMYPIKSTNEKYDCIESYSCESLYYGEQLEFRLLLSQHIINEIDKLNM